MNVLASPASSLEIVGANTLLAHSHCCQNLAPCDYRTEIPVSLLAFDWELFSAPEASHIPRLRDNF